MQVTGYVPGCTNGGGSTPSATRGCQTSRLGLVRAGTQLVSITYNSAPGKVILDQSVKALPVRCSAYVTGQLQHARCGRKSVGTAEEALVTSLERGKSRFPQLVGLAQPMEALKRAFFSPSGASMGYAAHVTVI